MKQFTKLSMLIFASILFFSSCKEEAYADWKVLNELKYAEEVATKTNYTLTESGLCYNIIHQGETPKQVNPSSIVKVKFTGKLITGKVFDSGTYSGYLYGTVAGWQEAIVKLKVGGTMDFILPPSLGYGKEKTGSIPAYSMLYFSIELLDAQN